MGRRAASLRLSYRQPFAVDAVLRFLSDRAVPGIEAVGGSTYRRSVRLGGGHAVVVSLTLDPMDPHVVLSIPAIGVSEQGPLVGSARRMFDLDADPSEIDDHLSGDVDLRRLVRRTRGIRVPGTCDGFELAVRAVLGQQVSVAAARTLAGRLVERFGEPLKHPSERITHAFPTAERLARSSIEGLGLPAARAETIRRLARCVAVGELDLGLGGDRSQALQVLGSIPGIGPWTRAYVAMRGLGDADAFPASDLGVRRGFEALGLRSDRRAITARAERWRPWRAYAVMHLWHGHD